MPKLRVGNRQGELRAGFAQDANVERGRRAGELMATRIEQKHEQVHCFGLATGVADRHGNWHRPVTAGVPDGVGENPVSDHMSAVTLDEPSVTIKAGAFIPPAFHRFSVDANGERVGLLAVASERGKVDRPAGVAAVIAMHQIAVEPNRAMGSGSVEAQLEVASAIGGVEAEMPTIPAYAARAETLGKRFGFNKWLLHGPIMGQVDQRPGAVVEGGGSGAAGCTRLRVSVAVAVADELGEGEIAAVEAPVGIKGKNFAWHCDWTKWRGGALMVRARAGTDPSFLWPPN